MVEIYDLSEDIRQVVDQLQEQGYQTALEFKPRVDWPKEDDEIKGDRYAFACTASPDNDYYWIMEVADNPNDAVLKVLRKLSE